MDRGLHVKVTYEKSSSDSTLYECSCSFLCAEMRRETVHICSCRWTVGHSKLGGELAWLFVAFQMYFLINLNIKRLCVSQYPLEDLNQFILT